MDCLWNAMFWNIFGCIFSPEENCFFGGQKQRGYLVSERNFNSKNNTKIFSSGAMNDS